MADEPDKNKSTNEDQDQIVEDKPAEETPAEEATAEDQPDPAQEKPEDNPVAEKPDELKGKKAEAAKPASFKAKFHAFLANKKVSIPTITAIVLAIIFLIPATRYTILGLFIKKNFSVVITDSQTTKPVSSATVSLAGKTTQTDKDGKATLNVKLGKATISVQKKYYKNLSSSVMVGFKQSSPQAFQMQATGRQVPVVIKNKITGAPVVNAQVKAADTEGKTDKDGKLTIVLPADKSKVDATVTLGGYNDAKVSIAVTDKEVPENTFTIVPAGKLYFLSKQSGKIDVVKTDLDGSNRQTVLAGTGKEEETGTVLLASRDWKYLTLKSKRDSGKPKLYLIDTSTDKLTTMDEGEADFTMIGWVNSSFAYKVDRTGVQAWQPKSTALKAYNASSKAVNVIYETDATGDQNNYAREIVSWTNTVGSNELVFYATWQAHHATYSTTFNELSGKQAQLIGVTLSPSVSKKTIKTFSLGTTTSDYTQYFYPYSSYSNALYQPEEIYFSIDNNNTTTYYKLENDKLDENSTEAKQFFDEGRAYPTYLLSPNGEETLWTESRDGKNTFFIGDSNGAGGKQLVALDEANPYGWYTSDYVLVSKKNSELYILSRNGGTPFKVSDYHKPALSLNGYGGGYGGL